MGRKSFKEDEKKAQETIPKERWLLTRKTWKYMTDVGWNFIPENSTNRQDDITKIEEYFQNICKREKKFILCCRKTSYPGAFFVSSRYSKPSCKILNDVNNRYTLSSIDDTENELNKDPKNIYMGSIIKLLKNYLNIADSETSDSNYDEEIVTSNNEEVNPLSISKLCPANIMGKSLQPSKDAIDLLEKLKLYSVASDRPIIQSELITADILGNKILLKRIYNDLKKRQMHRTLGKHTPSLFGSLLSFHCSIDIINRNNSLSILSNNDDIRINNFDNINSNNILPNISPKSLWPEKIYLTCGTQTDFIPLNVLQQMAKEDEEFYKRSLSGNDKAIPSTSVFNRSRRQSCIESGDISQSVSDTIKRYLRMVRKKNANDDPKNRFKCVNYDNYLCNNKSKINSDINFGYNDGNTKSTQTLNAWAILLLHHIRGVTATELLNDLHLDWLNFHRQREREKKSQLSKTLSTTSFINNNITTGGLFHSGTQYLCSLLHGNSHHNPRGSSFNVSNTLSIEMQKSKSSSNVGQLVAKKIWKSRSKSQTRSPSPNMQQWIPQGNCIWRSTTGKKIVLVDSWLFELTEVEQRTLHKVAIDKIDQLNIGVNISTAGDLASTYQSKIQKRRPLLIKRKAITTSFFDIGKKGETKGIKSGLVFGVSLEKCLDNDYRIQKKNDIEQPSPVSLTDRNSRNSIISFKGTSWKNSRNIGSYENLSTTLSENMEKSYPPTLNISRSQCDIRRFSQEDENLKNFGIPLMCKSRCSCSQVPVLVTACIKHLEEHGLHTVGIFRVSTSKKRVKQLREDFDRAKFTTLDPDICPHDVATILKEYLRDLPEPLLCRNLYKPFVKTQKIRNRRLQLEALSYLVQLLPVAHRDTLFILLKFLAKLVRKSNDVISSDGKTILIGNKMDSSNLATVFAPNILHCSRPGCSLTEEEFDEQVDVINVIRIMIDHYEELFKISAELIDEVYTNMIDMYPEQLNYLCERRYLSDIKLDDIDSNTSSTLLSSSSVIIPDLSNKQDLIVEKSNLSLNDNQIKKIYLREDFLHQNAAKVDFKLDDNPTRRYPDPDKNISRRKRQDKGKFESTLLRERQQYQQRYSVESHSINKLSEKNKNCIDGKNRDSQFLETTFTTLQIPVQRETINSGLESKQFNQHINTEMKNIISEPIDQLDLSDVPLSEDIFCKHIVPAEGCKIQSNVSNQLPVLHQSPVAYERGKKTENNQRLANESKNLKLENVSDTTTKKLNVLNKIRKSKTTSLRSNSNQICKETPNISNIRGDVFRSKTADLERLLTGNKKIKNEQLGRTCKQKANFEPKSKIFSNLNQEKGPSQGQIYKRQELISSAHRKST